MDGHLEVGVELFNQGEVLAGGTCVACAGTILAAQFVRGVLLIEPDVSQVEVPTPGDLVKIVDEWLHASRRWHKQFRTVSEKALVGIEDSRTRNSIEQRALKPYTRPNVPGGAQAGPRVATLMTLDCAICSWKAVAPRHPPPICIRNAAFEPHMVESIRNTYGKYLYLC